jgi:ATP-binding cassette, subfamily A (ABC1), member 3
VTIALKDAIAASRQELPPDALDYDASGVHLGCLVIHCFLWPILLVCIEFGWFNCLRKKGKKIENEPEELDDDVLKEQQKVENTSESKLAVKADHLRKVYENNVAVKDVCFSLEFGDCFALLGVNGAGKTTTFKCLTNDVVPTKGIPYIVGHDVRKEFSEARKHIGYCPQFDAIFELLTVREHLEFYAKIKKIPKKYEPNLIKALLKSMNLEQYENKRSGTLSGGNKRKLSVAMAMLGNPPVVFLDEPSAGMDPKARRFMWEIIAKISTRGKNSAVILTTHSMEEAEALSTSMGIMVDGQFKCFGSKQHIKNKFGFGYQVEIKFKTLENDKIQDIIEEKKILEFLRDKYTS